jgi:hypothetical protein
MVYLLKYPMNDEPGYPERIPVGRQCRSKSVSLCLACLAVLCFIGAFSPALAREAQMPDPATLQRLQSGEITVETTRSDESGGSARFAIYIQAPVEDIWAIIFSCENAFIFLDGLKVCEVLHDDGTETLTRQVVKKSWLIPTQDYTFRTLRQPYKYAEFKRVEGKPRVMEGSWEFVVMPYGVVITHEIRIQPSMPVPRFIVRHLMRNSMPEMLACMRGLAGGSPDAEYAARDLRDCPGKIN